MGFWVLSRPYLGLVGVDEGDFLSFFFAAFSRNLYAKECSGGAFAAFSFGSDGSAADLVAVYSYAPAVFLSLSLI